MQETEGTHLIIRNGTTASLFASTAALRTFVAAVDATVASELIAPGEPLLAAWMCACKGFFASVCPDVTSLDECEIGRRWREEEDT